MNQISDLFRIMVLLVIAALGCSGSEANLAGRPPDAEAADDAVGASHASPLMEPPENPAALDGDALPVVSTDVEPPVAEPRTMQEILSNLQTPPPWLDSVELDFDRSLPWNKTWDRIEVLLQTAELSDRQQAIKLAYLYQQDGRAKTGYPASVYFSCGEYAWAIREFASLEDKNSTTYMRMASCYLHFDQHDLALACLEQAEQQVTEASPWDTFRRGQVLEAKADVYADRADIDPARDNYRQAIACYEQTALPANQQLVKNRSIVNLQSKLEMLNHRELHLARLADGQFVRSAPGYSDTIRASVTIAQGSIAKIDIKHSERADLQSTRIIPERIMAKQDIHVDAISGATITSQAVKNAVFQALKQAAEIE